jgi:hypothetical protein
LLSSVWDFERCSKLINQLVWYCKGEIKIYRLPLVVEWWRVVFGPCMNLICRWTYSCFLRAWSFCYLETWALSTPHL